MNKKLILLSLLILLTSVVLSVFLYSIPGEKKIWINRGGEPLSSTPLQNQTFLAERLEVTPKIKAYTLHFENKTNLNNNCSLLPGYNNFFRITVPRETPFITYADAVFERETYPNKEGQNVPLDKNDLRFQYYRLKVGEVVEFTYPGDLSLSFDAGVFIEESSGWKNCALDIENGKNLTEQGLIIYAKASWGEWVSNFIGVVLFLTLVASSLISIWQWSRK